MAKPPKPWVRTQRSISFEGQNIDDLCQRMRQVFEGKSALEAVRLMGELHRICIWYKNAPEPSFHVNMDAVLQQFPVRLTSIDDCARR